jgi:hypothetical protein
MALATSNTPALYSSGFQISEQGKVAARLPFPSTVGKHVLTTPCPAQAMVARELLRLAPPSQRLVYQSFLPPPSMQKVPESGTRLVPGHGREEHLDPAYSARVFRSEPYSARVFRSVAVSARVSRLRCLFIMPTIRRRLLFPKFSSSTDLETPQQHATPTFASLLAVFSTLKTLSLCFIFGFSSVDLVIPRQQ